MEMILCQCDWDGLGPVPPHWHVNLVLVRRRDKPYDAFWIPHFIPQSGFEVLHEVEEIHFNVPWRSLWQQYGT